jgi:hypothetical protein
MVMYVCWVRVLGTCVGSATAEQLVVGFHVADTAEAIFD